MPGLLVAADRAEQLAGPGLEIRLDARRAAFADGLAGLLDPLAANADRVRDVRRIAYLDPGAVRRRAHRTALEPQRTVSGSIDSVCRRHRTRRD